MKVYEILGFRKVDYFSQKKNRQFTGVDLHVACDSARSDFSGKEVKCLWISDRIPCSPAVGDHVHIYFDEKGHVEAIALAE